MNRIRPKVNRRLCFNSLSPGPPELEFHLTLAEILPPGIIYALYADDVTIPATHEDIKIAEAQAQAAVNTVINWCKEWKLNLNATKSEVSLFTTAKYEAKIKVIIKIV